MPRFHILNEGGDIVRTIIADEAFMQANHAGSYAPRKWVDLQRPDVIAGVNAIAALVPAVTPAIAAAVLTTPVSAEENRAMRRQFF